MTAGSAMYGARIEDGPQALPRAYRGEGAPMEQDNRESLFEALQRFRRAWVSRGWSWDNRLDCVASTFDVAHADQARRAVTSVLTQTWTSENVKDAPPVVASVAEATGGVRADQVLYTTRDVEDVMAYGLWWPWRGSGTNISMRVGLVGLATFDDVMRLREIFGALDG